MGPSLRRSVVEIKRAAGPFAVGVRKPVKNIVGQEFVVIVQMIFIIAEINIPGHHHTAGAGFRHSELWSVEAQGRALRLSDDNWLVDASARGELQLFATGYLRGTVSLEVLAGRASQKQDRYYAPRGTFAALLAPSLEHQWLRFRRYSLSHRLTLGGGVEHETVPGLADRWRAGYQQVLRIGDAGELVLEAGLWRRHFEGRPELGAHLSLGGRVRF